MSKATIQAIVGEMADAFLAAGLADPAVYKAPGKSPAVDCRVFISRLRQPFGEFGTVVDGNDTVTLLLSEVPAPVRGATVVADGNTFTLVRMVKQDEAISEWEVQTA